MKVVWRFYKYAAKTGAPFVGLHLVDVDTMRASCPESSGGELVPATSAIRGYVHACASCIERSEWEINNA